MDARALDEVVKALRSAARALRAAEKALLQSPSDAAPAFTEEPVAIGDPTTDPREKALSDFLFAAVAHAKQYEEQDPQSFRANYEPLKDSIREASLRGDMYQIGPKGSGMVSFDNTTATHMYEKCLAGMQNTGLPSSDIVASYVDAPVFKPWSEVDVENDLVLMRYETPGPIEANLDEAQLSVLAEAARQSPGAVDRCRSALADAGVTWAAFEATGALVTTMTLTGVNGQWAACADTNDILSNVLSRLSVIEIDFDNEQQGWWDAARQDRAIPQKLLKIIRNQEKDAICHRTEIDKIEDWAASLPGWYEGVNDASPTPLIMRDAVANDIL